MVGHVDVMAVLGIEVGWGNWFHEDRNFGWDGMGVLWNGRGEERTTPASCRVWGGRSRSGDGRSRGNVGEIEIGEVGRKDK